MAAFDRWIAEVTPRGSFHAGMTVATTGVADLLGGLDVLIAAQSPLTHNALDDALAQARLFEQRLGRRGIGDVR